MSADLFAYEDGTWKLTFRVKNPDGSQESRTIEFDVQEGAKVYRDSSNPVISWRYMDNYISQERLSEIWRNTND